MNWITQVEREREMRLTSSFTLSISQTASCNCFSPVVRERGEREKGKNASLSSSMLYTWLPVELTIDMTDAVIFWEQTKGAASENMRVTC